MGLTIFNGGRNGNDDALDGELGGDGEEFVKIEGEVVGEGAGSRLSGEFKIAQTATTFRKEGKEGFSGTDIYA